MHDYDLTRPTWQRNARCRGTDPALFFPGRGERVTDDVLAMCAACPVADQCREWAIENFEYQGWWNSSARERRRIRRQQRGLDLDDIAS